jgi:D-glycero-D-manno-heptose 1,7-bisphosphate phosphatase
VPEKRDVLIDRDGVITKVRADYVKTLGEMEFLPGAIESLVRLSRSGHRVFVVTNQSAIGRGLTTREEVDRMHQRLAQEVRTHGGEIEAFLICPHTPDDHCGCRKPAPGLLYQARDRYGVDLRSAILIGDNTSDLQAAHAAGCVAILVLSGESGVDGTETADPVAVDLAEAVELVVSFR